MGSDSLSASAINPRNAQMLSDLARQAPGVVNAPPPIYPLRPPLGANFAGGAAAAGYLGQQLAENPPALPIYPATGGVIQQQQAPTTPEFQGGQNPAVERWLVSGTVTTQVQEFGQESFRAVTRFYENLPIRVEAPIRGFVPWTFGLVGGLVNVRPQILGASGGLATVYGEVYLGTNYGNNKDISWTGTFTPDPAYNPPNTQNPSAPTSSPIPNVSPDARYLTPDLGLNPTNDNRQVGAPTPSANPPLDRAANPPLAPSGALAGSPPFPPLTLPDTPFFPTFNGFPPVDPLGLAGNPPIIPPTRPGGRAPSSNPPSTAAGGIDPTRRDTILPINNPPEPEEEPRREGFPIQLPQTQTQTIDCKFTNTHQERLKKCRDEIAKEISGEFHTERALNLREDPSQDPPSEDDVKDIPYSSESAFDYVDKALQAMSKQLEELRKDFGLISPSLSIPDSWNVKTVPHRRQLVVLFAPTKDAIRQFPESKGSRWQLVIPYPTQTALTRTAKFPTYNKGNFMGICTLKDNSSIQVNCSDKTECLRVLRALIVYVDPQYKPSGKLEDNCSIVERKGSKLKKIRVQPREGHLYEQGRIDAVTKGKLKPDRIILYGN
jgi:hypothetical protein